MLGDPNTTVTLARRRTVRAAVREALVPDIVGGGCIQVADDEHGQRSALGPEPVAIGTSVGNQIRALRFRYPHGSSVGRQTDP